jgi:hypothetical protein
MRMSAITVGFYLNAVLSSLKGRAYAPAARVRVRTSS